MKAQQSTAVQLVECYIGDGRDASLNLNVGRVTVLCP